MEMVVGRIAVFPSSDEIFVGGTCFRITQDLYVTCRHVFEDFVTRFGHEKHNVPWAMNVVHIAQDGNNAIWSTDRLWTAPGHDLAVFHTIPANDIAERMASRHVVSLELAPPKIGEQIFAYGFPRTSGSVTVNADGSRHINIKASGIGAVGTVLDVHDSFRDRSLITWPSFNIKTVFERGMSGGPVFNGEGRVCGVIGIGTESNELGLRDHSYAWTLWPLMSIGIDLGIDGRSIVPRHPLLDLAKSGVIQASGWERVRLHEASQENGESRAEFVLVVPAEGIEPPTT